MTTAAARLPLQHPRSAAPIPVPSAIARIKLSRPVSAPVRRTKPTFAAVLRDRVNQSLIDPLTPEDNEQVVYEGRSESTGSGALHSRSGPREQHADDRIEDTAECRRLMRLLEEEVRYASFVHFAWSLVVDKQFSMVCMHDTPAQEDSSLESRKCCTYSSK